MASEQRWRSVVATLLLVLGSLTAFVAVPAAWADRAMSTTEFRSTVRTIAEDPALQLTIAEQVTTALMARVDVTGNLNEVLDDLQEAPVGRSLIEDLRNLVKLSDAAGRALVQQRIQAIDAATPATRREMPRTARAVGRNASATAS